MKRIFVPTRNLEDWRHRLRDPDGHWRDGRSAKELATAWEGADSFPAEIEALLAASGEPALRRPKLLAAFPEWETELAGKGEASHTDILVVAGTADGLAVLAVEGKAGEPFGDTVAQWLEHAAPGKPQNRLDRLAFLQSAIGLGGAPVSAIRYQLLHRTAAAVLEARHFQARYAVLIVHSFGEPSDSLCDYQRFTALFGQEAGPGKLVKLCEVDGVLLLAGWATGQPSKADCCRTADSRLSPFGSYPTWLRDNPRCLGSESSRAGYALTLQRITRQTCCAYCGLDLSDTYDHWLLLTVDHVIPGYMRERDGWRQWVDNANNLVICCSACNGYLNRFPMAPDAAAPTEFEEFERVRNLVFGRKTDQARRRHERERRFFAAKPWESEIDPSTLPRRP